MWNEETTEAYFDEYSVVKDDHFRLKETLENLFAKYFQTKDEKFLQTLIVWFKDNSQSHSIFSTFSEMVRYSHILEIIEMEKNMGFPCFISNVNNLNELLDKYIKTILYMRRLEMNFPENYIKESAEYINNMLISPIALSLICQYEIYRDRKKILIEAAQLYDNNLSSWTDFLKQVAKAMN